MIENSGIRICSPALLIALIEVLLTGCFISRKDKEKEAEFRIVLIPDTQYYTAQTRNATVDMFRAQISWIKKYHRDSSIAYVAGMGDIVDDYGKGDPVEKQWENAVHNGGYYALEEPAPGIPYGLAIGNHDEADENLKFGDPRYHHLPGLNPPRNTTRYYNHYFGVEHFKNKPWYGGHANIAGKNNNDCHFDKFTVAGQKYIVVFLPFDDIGNGEDKQGLMTSWADSVLKANPLSKAFIVSHSMLTLENDKGQNAWSRQGKRIYEALKGNTNIIAMLCGHISGEGFRRDVYNGHVIRTYLTDYQSEKNGGNGKMRTMRINTRTDSNSLRTFSPYLGQH
ncbi:metallophosphoesterase [Desertivirga xinjiangensis]|uniref:metallophosphoesterase n=1 Tax=Desertivirga xinjiangensis TaxID=539206 RepID=UPI00210A3E52|nr:metallophosphoesterase [Pedobacter xinjiangensis]